MLWIACALETQTELRFGHGCSDDRLLLEHERDYGLGMHALVSVCFWNTFGHRCFSIIALVTRTEFPPHLRKPPAYPPCRVCTTAEYEPCTNYFRTLRDIISNVKDFGRVKSLMMSGTAAINGFKTLSHYPCKEPYKHQQRCPPKGRPALPQCDVSWVRQ